MTRRLLPWYLVILLVLAGTVHAQSMPNLTAELRLVPYPKQVLRLNASLPLSPQQAITVNDAPAAAQAAADLKKDLAGNAQVDVAMQTIQQQHEQIPWLLTLADHTVPVTEMTAALRPLPTQRGGYALIVSDQYALVGALSYEGLVAGIQTLRQIVRANANGHFLPGVIIHDYPSLRYRGWQNDITRGPSPKLDTLLGELAQTVYLKMNCYSYYLEHQYAFSKYPYIGPTNGSLTPAELTTLVSASKRYGVEVFGNQQSLGHLYQVLHHDQLAMLREDMDTISPVNEKSYSFLDNLYSEQAPLIASPFFNVCCDESYGLGNGPSRSLINEIGVGNVYARHINRLHDILRDRYDKRMMMWGDILLRHPEVIRNIYADTVILVWAYDPRDSFESDIVPFRNAGLDFFVCPGVSCWNRILPDIEIATTNIGNFVRDGTRLGALGMLNTTWRDDGETLMGTNWYSLAWGAECAWNGSTTTTEAFNRRIGAVLFGEKGDRFGQAITLLSRANQLPGYQSMSPDRFWKPDDGLVPIRSDLTLQQATELKKIADSAIEHLRAVKAEATTNIHVLDCYLFTAEKMRLIATRQMDFLQAAQHYAEACQETRNRDQQLAYLYKTSGLIDNIRRQHAVSQESYRLLWQYENRPYSLNNIMAKYNMLLNTYAAHLTRIQQAIAASAEGRALPSATEVGLDIRDGYLHTPRLATQSKTSLCPLAPWRYSTYARRVGFTVSSGNTDRVDVPLEINASILTVPADGIQLVELNSATGEQWPLSSQVYNHDQTVYIQTIVHGMWKADSVRYFFLYYDGFSNEKPAVTPSVTCQTLKNGCMMIENSFIRLTINPIGAHISKWEIKGMNNINIADQSQNNWSGFADVNISGKHRNTLNRFEILQNGPMLVRLQCIDETGLVKIFSVWEGVPWVEVNMGNPISWFCGYDHPDILGTTSPTPGFYLCSNGSTGQIKPMENSSNSQVRIPKVNWGIKYHPDGALLGLVTPERSGTMTIGPGAGWGAIGIESDPPALHFIIVGARCPQLPRDTFNGLRDALDYRNRPALTCYATQKKLNHNSGGESVKSEAKRPSVGVCYHATSSDFDQAMNEGFKGSTFLRNYHRPKVREAVRRQLQAMADAGAEVIKTGIWLVDSPPNHDDRGWCMTFPLSPSELTNIRSYAADVAQIRRKDGRALELNFALMWSGLWSADYTVGSPETTVGRINLPWNEFLRRATKTVDDLLGTLSVVKRPDGTKAVSLVYLTHEMMIGAKKNEDSFLMALYPHFLTRCQEAGIEGSIYFNVDVRHEIVFDNGYVDHEYPVLTGHRSMYWLYRSIAFLQKAGLKVPARLDTSLYLDFGDNQELVNTDYARSLTRILDDFQAVFPGARLGIVETSHPLARETRMALGRAFLGEYTKRGLPERVIFWTTPDGGGKGNHVGFPFDFQAYGAE